VGIPQSINRQGSLFEYFRLRASPYKDDGVAIHAVDEQEVAADVTFAAVCPITLQ
jgi:hypothetical protein